MKNRSILLIASALLILPTGGAFAAENNGFSGSIELGGRLSDSEDEGAKFQEYRDLESAILGSFVFDFERDANYVELEGTNVGLDDQSYLIEGGNFNFFKFSLFYDEIPHNLTFGARTFYSGTGTGVLSIDSSSPANQSTWKGFDYNIETKKYGGDVELFRTSPFYLQVKVDREEKDGVKPLGTGSFSGAVELPEPVDYTTNNVEIAGGYRSDEISFQLSGMYSTFDNDNSALHWENPFLGVGDLNALPQENDYGKFGASLVWRQLPMMSTLAIKASYTDLSSDLTVAQLGESIPAGLNHTTFDGDITTTRISAVFDSRPLDKLDTRLFFEYYDRENDSTVIEYNGGGNDEHLYDYSKYKLGFDAGYRLASHTRLSGGYSFEDVDRRNRPDASSNSDNLVFIKLKNTSLDFLEAKVEYSYLNRDADEEHDLSGLTMFDAEYIAQFVQRFDATSKSKHALEFAFDIFPMEKLDFGVSYTLVKNDYDDVTLGRTEDTGHELYFDFIWRAMKMLTLSGFAGYENYDADSNHYNFQAGAGAPPQAANPLINDGNPSSYRWSQFIEEDFWTIGLAAKMGLMQDRLQFSLSAQYQESDGDSDFTAERSSALVPIDEYEDYYITTLEAKVFYAFTETLGFNLGYLFEKSNYDDLQYDGYILNPGGTLLSGANSDHDYEAHVAYFTVQYSF